MAFEAKLNENQAQAVINLIDAAIRANGIQAARVGIPIVDSLSSQASEYNQSLVEPVPAPKPCAAEHDAR